MMIFSDKMFYVAHRIYLSKENFLRLHVVEVVNKRVLSVFPFDTEKEAMVWADALVLSDVPLHAFAGTIDEVLPSVGSDNIPTMLYEVQQADNGYCFRKIS